jgi:hypothetical protein
VYELFWRVIFDRLSINSDTQVPDEITPFITTISDFYVYSRGARENEKEPK